MASIRRGYSDDFTLKNNSVGIGTSVGQEALDVVDGSVKGQDLKVTGIASFTAYEGFLRSNHQIAENTTLSFDQGPVSSLSGEIIVGTGKTVTIDNLPDGEHGPELITNGSFISTTSGWTAYNAVISISNGQLKIDDTANAGSWSSAVQEVNTEPSVKYRLEVGIGTETEGSIYGIYNGRYPSAGTAPYYQSPRFDPGEDPAVGIVTDVYEFIATEKITSIILTANNDGIVHFDNVSLKKINVPEEPRAGGSEIECLKVFNTFTPPSGGTNDRPYAPKPGELYYNYDFKTIEFFDGNGWRQVDNTTRSGRGIVAGGRTPTPSSTELNNIDYITIPTTGNAIDFGDLSANRNQAAGSGSETRGLFSGGWDGSSRLDTIEYVTIASSGNAIDFGNLTQGRSHPGSCSSSTRSIVGAGFGPNYRNEIDYVEIATIGNSLDFGDTTVSRDELTGLSSPTRGIFAGGSTPTRQSVIEFVSFATLGDALDFGELSRASGYLCGGGNGTRGIVVAGQTPSITDYIDQITIATTGNAVDFGGTCAVAMVSRGGSACTKTRMVFGGGSTTSPSTTVSNHIEYITINSNGNGIDFGDLTIARTSPGACSDSHGGLGGF